MSRLACRTLVLVALISCTTVSATLAEAGSLVGTWRNAAEVSPREVGSPAPVAAPPAASSIEANKALVRSLFDAFNRGDLEALNRIVDRRRVFHSATVERTGNGEPTKTLAEACPMCASLNPRQITIDAMMAEGDLVTVRSTWRGTYSGLIRDVNISGKEIAVYYTNTYRIADGRIVENWAAYDRLHLLEQLGFSLTPPPASPAP